MSAEAMTVSLRSNRSEPAFRPMINRIAVNPSQAPHNLGQQGQVADLLRNRRFVYGGADAMFIAAPAGRALTYRERATGPASARAAIKAQCTPATERRITRWEHVHLDGRE